MDSFTSSSVAFESVRLTDTDGEEHTLRVGETANLASGSLATGLRVAEDLAVTPGDYRILELHYSIERVVPSSGETAAVAFTSPGVENVVKLDDKPATIEESNLSVLQTHFALTSVPWNLFTPTVVLGPRIPE